MVKFCLPGATVDPDAARPADWGQVQVRVRRRRADRRVRLLQRADVRVAAGAQAAQDPRGPGPRAGAAVGALVGDQQGLRQPQLRLLRLQPAHHLPAVRALAMGVQLVRLREQVLAQHHLVPAHGGQRRKRKHPAYPPTGTGARFADKRTFSNSLIACSFE